MKNSYKALPREKRKKILLMCDDIRTHSGVANMARELVINSVQHFNWVNLAASLSHPEAGKILDLSESLNKEVGISDASVILYPNSGYGDAKTVRAILQRERPDAIFLFTDPRYWTWLFEMEREIRSSIPIFYLNIWDNYPAPMYNKPYYESCDLLMAISKQTLNINRIVLGDLADKKVLRYVPHGVDPTKFYPIRSNSEESESFEVFKQSLFGDRSFDFVAFYNSRNLRRKQTPNVIAGFVEFCKSIGHERAKKCALLLHTSPVDEAGTDLLAVKEALGDPTLNNIFFSSNKLSQKQMNMLYNVADVNILTSSAEGWGLSVTEATMAGTMSLVNVTGGIQDQCRFEDEGGGWIDFSVEFPSNHRGTYKKHGPWVVPLFPKAINIVGSVPTPYIYEDIVTLEQIEEGLSNIYGLSKEQRDFNGDQGRKWAIGPEAGFTSEIMTNRMMDACDEAFETFSPRKSYDLIKVGGAESKQVNHNLLNY